MIIHFIDAGLGNMVLIRTSVRDVLYDCNITDDNEERVLGYLGRALGMQASIELFICSHPDYVHGIKRLHSAFPIGAICDSGVPGTSPDSNEYKDYMDLKQKLDYVQIKAMTNRMIGEASFRWLNSASPDYSDPDAQSVVLKIEDHVAGSSCLLAGHTNFRPWKEKILPFYNMRVKSDILFAPHHGSLSFFQDPSDPKNYYTEHIKMINPAITIISVGPNTQGLPDDKAVELYTKHTTGNKVFTTQDKGNIRIVLKNNGGWTIDSER